MSKIAILVEGAMTLVAVVPAERGLVIIWVLLHLKVIIPL